MRAALAVALAVAASCGGSSLGAPSAPASATPQVVEVSSAAPTERYEPEPADSKVTVRVREQLASLPASSDAVLETNAISGTIGIARDGLTTATALAVDLSSLRSDEPRRDNYVKRLTLETDRFPTAELRVVRTIGLPAPIPRAGEWRFQLVTQVTLHGVTREVTWQVLGQRLGRILKATATTTLRFADFGLERPRVAVVLSVQDEIRVEIALSAVQV